MPAAQTKECQLQRIAVRFEVPYRQGDRPEAELFQKFAVGIGRTGPNIGTTRRERSKNKHRKKQACAIVDPHTTLTLIRPAHGLHGNQ